MMADKLEEGIALGKPWGDEAETAAVRDYAERMHQSAKMIIERGVSTTVSHFAERDVPQSVVARTIIFSLIEAAADEVAHYLAAFEASDEQVQGAAEAYAGLMLVSIPKAVPEWRAKIVEQLSREARHGSQH
jgi:hypothetical protein